MASALLRPDVLVLAGGGIVGEAWMNGVLAGIEDGGGADFTDVEAYVGTSAGSIVAARLVSGRRPRRPQAGTPSELAEAEAENAEPDGHGLIGGAARVGFALGAPAMSAALALSSPIGAAARGAILRRAGDRGRSLTDLEGRIARWSSRFDGRLRVCAVDRGSGKRVVFGAPGAPAASVPEAVAASCAIPFYFRAIRIADREYVDGGAWSVSNLDAAPAGRDTQVLFLHPTASLTQPWAKAFRVATELELQTLRRRGATVRHVTPDTKAATAIGGQFMDPARIGGVLAAGYAQGLRLTS